VSREALIQAYISGLNLAEVAIVGAGRQCRVITGEIAPGEPVACCYYFKASHAELLLRHDRPGWHVRPAGGRAGGADRAGGGTLGAPYQTPDALRKAAAEQVAEIVERVKTAGLSGRLKRWNAAYKQYRVAQVAKAEPAIPYAAFLEQVVTLPTVKQLAMTGRTV
jgi:hypothetical protein